jgi:hypothetical protein
MFVRYTQKGAQWGVAGGSALLSRALVGRCLIGARLLEEFFTRGVEIILVKSVSN